MLFFGIIKEPAITPSADDHILVKRVQAGNREAFDELVKRYYGAVYNLAAHSIQNGEEREDVIQEIFLKAYRSISGFRFQAAFSTWLYSIAKNMLIDISRKKHPLQVSIEKEAGGIRIGDTLSDSRDDPEKRLMENNAEISLRKALMNLEENHKQILILREMEGLSYMELSKALGINIGTVKSRLARAREELRIILSEKYPA